MDFVKELKWRGMIHNIMPGTQEQLLKEITSGYVGFDPTADSLHIGNLVPIMLLTHFQNAGHKPIALVGGATGMIGDPSGKSEERNFLTEEVLNHNLSCQKKQLEKFLNFDSAKPNAAEIVNNYDWFKDFSFLGFMRDVGKHITVNYMMAKDSVKNRMETGISFTEFSYQLVQGYDFYHLNQHKNCKIQMGGSDQWGNIVTGTELIRRKSDGEAFALTCPLITKSDGSKFGKSEGGNVWLDKEKTSPYKFYQFWLNASDEDASKYIRIFTLKSEEEILAIEKEHAAAPHLRVLQKSMAEDITVRVHSQEDLENAIEASNILFGNSTTENLKKLSEDDLLSVFSGVPQANVSRKVLIDNIGIIDFAAEQVQAFSSKGEARKMIQGNGVSINKEKVNLDKTISSTDLLLDKYILLQKGKKNYYLVTVV
ncbi:MAG: tyrosine--tRNA ligase [Bacteroidetes bacterium]|nr:MAG: tyrosine--tRNA ligase [Bacteroidota bacterium]MBL1143561.1 tyrosine--tRNA ligase [Bacteroidota bacterium]NOG56363.1 tyrosine--tRNA ligase [Bacteroidota bacterium]